MDLLIESNLEALLDLIRPRTVLDCVAYGAYSFETDSQLIYRTNFQLLTRCCPGSSAIDCLLRARRQLLGIRRPCGRPGGNGPDRPQ